MIEGQELAVRMAFNRAVVQYRPMLENAEKRIMESLRLMGIALRDIEKNELWKYVDGEEYSSMNDYCQNRWGFGERRRQQILQADNTRLALADIVETPQAKLLLENVKEGQMRAIMEVPVYDRPKLTDAVAVEVERPKGSDIRKKAKEMGLKSIRPKKPKPQKLTVCPLCHGSFQS